MRNIPKDHFFTEQEKQFIIEHFYDMSGPELFQVLNKTAKQIYCFARQRGLKHRLTAACILREIDLDRFLELYPDNSNSYLAEKYFTYLTARQITSLAKRLGVKKKDDQRFMHFTEQQLLDRLNAAVIEHGRTPLLTEIKA